jgi:hypothetical protein
MATMAKSFAIWPLGMYKPRVCHSLDRNWAARHSSFELLPLLGQWFGLIAKLLQGSPSVENHNPERPDLLG